MAHKVQVNAGVTALVLPDGNIYDGVTEVTLTDDEFARIRPALFTNDILDDLGSVADPDIDADFVTHDELDATVLPGTGLDRAENGTQVTLTNANERYDVCSITFDVPATRDVEITAKAPLIGGAAGAQVFALLADGADVELDMDGVRVEAANHFASITLSELIPAGSGTVTRKLRAYSSLASGFVNLIDLGTSFIDAKVR